MALLGKWPKQPHEQIAYPIDFTDWMAENPGDTIDTYTVVADAGISVVTHARVGNIITVVMGGGTNGTTYKVTVTINTTPGPLIKEAEFYVKVKEI